MDKAPLKKKKKQKPKTLKRVLQSHSFSFEVVCLPFICCFLSTKVHKDFHSRPESSPPLSALLGVTNWPLILPFPAGFIWTAYPRQQVHLGSRVSQPWRQRLSGSREIVSRNGLRFQILVAQAPWGRDAAEKAAGRVSRGQGWGMDGGLGCESEGGKMLWSPPRAPGPHRHPAHPTLPPAWGTTGNVMFYLEWFRTQTLRPP